MVVLTKKTLADGCIPFRLLCPNRRDLERATPSQKDDDCATILTPVRRMADLRQPLRHVVAPAENLSIPDNRRSVRLISTVEP